MSTTTTTHPAVTTSIESENNSYPLSNIGVEFEVPLAEEGQMVPAGRGRRSDGLRDDARDEYGRDSWLSEDFGPNDGYVGSDHTGAEITSHILDLHSNEPEQWYRATIDRIEELGYEFAATGYGATVFGLHMHLSEFSSRDESDLLESTRPEWGRVFFCASVSENSLDPWRHSGASPGRAGHHVSSSRFEETPSPQYEFRHPEPGLPEHVSLIFDFFRIFAADSPEAARDFARERVYEKDERLTPIVQYNQLKENLDDWPNEEAFRQGGGTDPAVAEWFHDLMENDG